VLRRVGVSSALPSGGLQDAAVDKAPAYKEIKVLGKGSFGTTYLAEHTATLQLVALKQVDAVSSVERDAALEEYRLMHALQHVRLVSAREAFVEPLKLGQFRVNIVMEYCDGGHLGEYLQQHQPLTEADVCRMLKSVAAALAVLHSRGIVHRDLKPSNVLLCTNGAVKLGDFGLAKPAGSRTSKAVGTLVYMSTEAFAGRFQPSVDVWALGVMAVETASAIAPTELLRTDAQIAEYIRSAPPEFSQHFRSTVRKCLDLDPAKRPTAAELENGPDFTLPTSPIVSESLHNLQAAVDTAAWSRPSRVEGLEWRVTSVGDAHSVKLSDCSDQILPAQQRAVEELLALVSAAGSDVLSRCTLSRVVLSWSRAREAQLFAKIMDLNFKYANKPLFSLEQPMRRGSAVEVDARRRTLDWFHATYRSLTAGYPNVRTLLAFHATPSEQIAEQVRSAV
jgi:serine/threonine protein kinase